jgi:hypothetical protein
MHALGGDAAHALGRFPDGRPLGQRNAANLT